MKNIHFQKHLSLILALSFFTAFLFAACSGNDSDDGKSSGSQSTKITGASIQLHGYDWGPSIDKVIVSDSEYGPFTDLSPASFSAVEEKEDSSSTRTEDRKVENVYYSDASGKELEDKNSYTGDLYLTLELQVGPEEGAFLYFDNAKSSNQWFSEYSLEAKLSNGKTIKFSKEDVTYPELTDVKEESFSEGPDGHAMSYAFYEPENASASNLRPLVIWLHGGGEGGTDPRITCYGNKTVALFGEEFQQTMDGAYVLVPQCPGAWIETGDSYHSVYLSDLKALFDQFSSSHNVDKSRIYVGGCSNGGYMALDLVLSYPDYFAKAFPVCEILDPEELSDEELSAIKDIPMWFVYAKNDMTVPPQKYEEPLLERLRSLGASELHVSVFDGVKDTSGKYSKDGAPYEYYGHFSWIYFFNNECTDGDLSLWQWLAGS